ncbi:N-acyl-D-amino-acid deacylase family protein [Sphingomonas sp.]|jgi:N-acyl-D-aspartate/D-glutamate deacylase|uniref:N-acyl-D-amino-acid deacylase family protein n=1 Tax=Sphingomonas sp. TaxID=28214 RepID=UPI002E36AB2C|nr:amidohydrolase family protein [Sphingomonas sp.]HEX4694565.1 amidohydrolase family protein [Sphingomonas sp.]
MKLASALIAALLAGSSLGAAPTQGADVLIRGGTIYTGDEAPFTGDVAIRGDRIVAVGANLKIAATRTIDAKGMIVAPGFIDPHTHAGPWLASADAKTRLIPAFLLQGVTTAFIGNDGGGSIDVAGVLATPRTKPVGINFATYVGFGTIREAVIGGDARAPTPTELAREKALVVKGMCEGAIGFSTGLFYAPQNFSKTDEVIALSAEAAKRGGYYDSHIRDESSYTVGLAAAIDEAIAIGRATGMPIHISHIKALGIDVQGMAPAIIAKIDAARASGVDITASQYPWSASGTSLVASLVPLWAQDGGTKAMIARFDDKALQPRLRADMAENMRKRGGAATLLVTEGQWRGKYLSEIAAAMKTDPISAVIAVIRVHDAATVSFNMSEADIAAFMRQPWVMTDSDASSGHPRVWGTFARKYAKYVVADKVITLRQFIERSSTLTAKWFALKGRGELKPGDFADVVVFDPKSYAAQATYEQPSLPATGVRTVLVNGRVAVDNGKLTGVAAGRALPHTPTPGTCPPQR